MIIDGKQLAEEILKDLQDTRNKIQNRITLAVIVVGDIADNLSFIKAKENFAKKLDIDFRVYEFSENLSRKQLREKIFQIVKSKIINGVIIQLPLPEKFSKTTQYFLNSIIPGKDVDCLSSKNIGKFFADETFITPPAVEVINFLRQKFNLDFNGKLAVIIGYGNLIGKPIAHYVLKQHSTISVINSKTQENIKEILIKQADIIISGVGKKNLITDCKEGAVIIDFGYSFEGGKIQGDVDFEKLKDKAGLITSTPGGTGPILIAMLYKNLLKLANHQKHRMSQN